MGIKASVIFLHYKSKCNKWSSNLQNLSSATIKRVKFMLHIHENLKPLGH